MHDMLRYEFGVQGFGELFWLWYNDTINLIPKGKNCHHMKR